MGLKNYFKILCVFLTIGLLLGTAAAASDSGDRVWDENANQSLKYTWTPQTYSGFYYDLDTGEGSENLTVQLEEGSRVIEDGNLQYFTKPIETEFEYGGWGSYQVIGFMAERYFAGYTENTDFVNDDISVISDGQLSKVLLDDDEKRSLYAGSSLLLSEGYSLNIVEVDISGDKVWVQLEKDGDVIEDSFLSSNDDYVYETDLGDTEDVPLIAVHFSEIFTGRETTAVFVEGIFQVSDEYVKIEGGDEFGELEVGSISSSGIRMENEDSISLSKGDTVELMGRLGFVVADADELRFALEVEASEPGVYELRGTVYDEIFNTTVWTPFNFEGFYYNIDEDVSTERLVIKELDGRSIDDEMLVYSTKPELVEFEREDWGGYEVIGFLAEKYFAGYPEDAFGDSDRVSVLSDSILSKVLIDEDDKKSLFTGSSLILENGYSLKAAEIDVNGNSVLFELYKDGDLVDTGIVSSNGDYVYEADIGGADDVPMIAVHVSTVFRGTEVDAIFVEGIFQISDDYLELEEGDSFGEMELSSVSSSGITMENEDSISLSRDDTIDLMENVKFRVADSSELRFYPFVEVVKGDGGQLDIDMPDTLVVGEEVEILVTARGVAVGDVELFFEGESIGRTGDEGSLGYTPDTEGSFTVSAEKGGYVSGSKEVDVLAEGSRKLEIEVSPDPIREGDTISIKVTDSIGDKPVSGADVFLGGENVGEQTNEAGIVSYWVTTPGTYKINASKAGYEDGEAVIEVLEHRAEFVFTNLTIEPASVEAGASVMVTVQVENTGNAKDESTVELLVNGEAVDSETVSLDAGESTTLEFSHMEEEPGTYMVEIGDLGGSYDVTEKTPFLGVALTLGILLTVFVVLRRRKGND
ncbi:S-layer family duplication domain protein [Methanosarcina sp. MTP4]|uniref:S-layer protein domain-containing protein n=1 Tax=Methanosarcina sp. MTP4 TaxID=1434100 RepID=UPI000615BF4B|nr:S-layer protein domain-containing protein [Methanosarcina sp. MTP4]AKB25849.1 S-layer family duplication domain protein [Methanosarcina sp. MTP4]